VFIGGYGVFGGGYRVTYITLWVEQRGEQAGINVAASVSYKCLEVVIVCSEVFIQCLEVVIECLVVHVLSTSHISPFFRFTGGYRVFRGGSTVFTGGYRVFRSICRVFRGGYRVFRVVIGC